jgi:outer membrane lipoprotein SlyB
MNKYALLLLMIFTITSCVNYSYSPDVVSRADAQKQQYVVLGTIVDINSVTIEGDREIGAYAGAFIGGAAGKNITDSELESDVAAILGGLVGSAVGSKIGSNITRKDGIELIIETDAGRLLSIIQEKNKSYSYSINQRVKIIKRDGKSRVVPFG